MSELKIKNSKPLPVSTETPKNSPPNIPKNPYIKTCKSTDKSLFQENSFK
ncbi:MAG: hypothetical protein WBG30_09960 [Psychrilyobacter sp.]